MSVIPVFSWIYRALILSHLHTHHIYILTKTSTSSMPDIREDHRAILTKYLKYLLPGGIIVIRLIYMYACMSV